MGDDGNLLEKYELEVSKNEPIVLVFLTYVIEIFPLRCSKCVTVFNAVVQLEEHARLGISKPMLATESMEHTSSQRNE